MNDRAIIHYSEIALKGNNRAFFEKTLLFNIQKQSKGFYNKIRRISGRLIAEFEPGVEEELAGSLKKIFGIHHFEFGFETEAEMENMKKEVLKIFKEPHPSSFKVSASRSEKNYPFDSMDIEKELGGVIHEGLRIPVSLSHPESELSVEVVEGRAYFTVNRIEGAGGLPVGCSGKVVSLLSGGFDSPVATIRMMKRGCLPVLVHFHSYPYTTRDSIEKVKKLAEIISTYSPIALRLILIPFADIQRKITEIFSSKFRIIAYRRWMLWMAERIATNNSARALVTGDSVGQVSSQTIENIDTISEIVSLPVLRPLVGYDKDEIIGLSKQYGLYQTSQKPFDDCCSLFVEGSPATKTRIEDIKNIEKDRFDELARMAEEALSKAEIN